MTRQSTARRERERESLVTWCQYSNHPLNVSKMKELVIDFRKGGGVNSLEWIDGAKVEMIESVNFRAVNITNNSSTLILWTRKHTNAPLSSEGQGYSAGLQLFLPISLEAS